MKIKSALHIGYVKTEKYANTRHYVYGKLFWAALTSNLVQSFGKPKFREIGEDLKKFIKFGYFFPFFDGKLHLPKFTKNGLYYGNKENCISKNEFEKKVIMSKVGIAINPLTVSVEEEMLYHQEFINMRTIPSFNEEPTKQIYLEGIIWINEAESIKGKFITSVSYEEKNLNFHFNNSTLISLKNLIGIQVGGERSTGHGLIEFCSLKPLDGNELSMFCSSQAHNEKTANCCSQKDIDKEVIIEFEKHCILWSHLICNANSSNNVKGKIELLVGRDWGSNGAGRKIENYGYHWSPGSLVLSPIKVRVNEFGIFEVINE